MGLALKIVLSNLSMTDSIGRQALLHSVAEDDGEYEGVDPAVSYLFFNVLQCVHNYFILFIHTAYIFYCTYDIP